MKKEPEKFVNKLMLFVSRINKEKIKDIKKSFCLGISSFPIEVVILKYEEVYSVLRENSLKNKKIAMNDPDIRKFCIYSMGKIFTKHSLKVVDKNIFDLIFKTFL